MITEKLTGLRLGVYFSIQAIGFGLCVGLWGCVECATLGIEFRALFQLSTHCTTGPQPTPMHLFVEHLLCACTV